nr:MAG TPA: hypothetical protein [Caudoviricetes sp.]
MNSKNYSSFSSSEEVPTGIFFFVCGYFLAKNC